VQRGLSAIAELVSCGSHGEILTPGGGGARAMEEHGPQYLDATRFAYARKQTSTFTQRRERQTGNRRRKAASASAATNSRTESRPSAHRISPFNVLIGMLLCSNSCSCLACFRCASSFFWNKHQNSNYPETRAVTYAHHHESLSSHAVKHYRAVIS